MLSILIVRKFTKIHLSVNGPARPHRKSRNVMKVASGLNFIGGNKNRSIRTWFISFSLCQCLNQFVCCVHFKNTIQYVCHQTLVLLFSHWFPSTINIIYKFIATGFIYSQRKWKNKQMSCAIKMVLSVLLLSHSVLQWRWQLASNANAIGTQKSNWIVCAASENPSYERLSIDE